MKGRAVMDVAAIVFAESKREGTFAAKDFAAFVNMAGEELDEEGADEVLSDLAEAGKLRQIGPGVYACLPEARRADVPLEHPIFGEDVR